MNVFADLLVLLILTRLFGELVERIGLPASVGEILAGIGIATLALSYGDSFQYLHALVDSDVLVYSADVGIFCLMLLSGIDTEIKEIRGHFGKSFVVAIGGIALPLLSGYLLVWWLLPESDHRHTLSLLSGIVMSVTAVPAVARVLQELQLTHTRLGQIIIGAALFDDVIGLFLLAILLSVIQSGGFPGPVEAGLLVAKVSLFFVVTIILGTHVYPRVSRGLNTLQATSVEFSAMAIVGLAYGLFAESLGMHWLLGAFMAGLFFDRARVGVRSYSEVKLIFTALTKGMLAPLFFASIGLHFDPASLMNAPAFLILLVLVAFSGKIIGCGVPARMAGLEVRESLAVGIGMSTRGAVGFVVLSVAVAAGLFDNLDGSGAIAENLYSGLVLVGITTTMLVPVMLRVIQNGQPGKSFRRE